MYGKSHDPKQVVEYRINLTEGTFTLLWKPTMYIQVPMTLYDSWMCDETIVRILNSHYPHLKIAFNFTCTGLNRVLSAKAGLCTVQNPHAIYVAQFKTDCPYSGDRRKVFCYFRQDTNNNEPKMIQCLFQMLLINLLCQISCRETASVLAVTWSWW